MRKLDVIEPKVNIVCHTQELAHHHVLRKNEKRILSYSGLVLMYPSNVYGVSWKTETGFHIETNQHFSGSFLLFMLF